MDKLPKDFTSTKDTFYAALKSNNFYIRFDSPTFSARNDDIMIIYLKADMNSDIPLQTAAIFFLTNFYLKQGIC